MRLKLYQLIWKRSSSYNCIAGGFVFNIAIVNRHSHSVMREMDFDSFEIASFTVNVLMILCKLKEAIVIVA